MSTIQFRRCDKCHNPVPISDPFRSYEGMRICSRCAYSIEDVRRSPLPRVEDPPPIAGWLPAPLDSLVDVSREPPKLERMNGAGHTILGTLRYPGLSPLYITRAFFTFFWIPLVPGAFFIVRQVDSKHYVFYGGLHPKDIHPLFTKQQIRRFYLEVYLNALITLAVMVILICVFALIAALGS